MEVFTPDEKRRLLAEVESDRLEKDRKGRERIDAYNARIRQELLAHGACVGHSPNCECATCIDARAKL